jgi:hypothetical protein
MPCPRAPLPQPVRTARGPPRLFLNRSRALCVEGPALGTDLISLSNNTVRETVQPAAAAADEGSWLGSAGSPKNTARCRHELQSAGRSLGSWGAQSRVLLLELIHASRVGEGHGQLARSVPARPVRTARPHDSEAAWGRQTWCLQSRARRRHAHKADRARPWPLLFGLSHPAARLLADNKTSDTDASSDLTATTGKHVSGDTFWDTLASAAAARALAAPTAAATSAARAGASSTAAGRAKSCTGPRTGRLQGREPGEQDMQESRAVVVSS